VRRLPVAAFVALALATVAAFFVTQHLKVTTPLIAGDPIPFPGSINPVDGQVCRVRSPRGELERVNFRRMVISFYLLHRSDDVDVYIVDQDGTIVQTLSPSGVHMGVRRRREFVWNGREQNGSIAPDGTYYIRVSLIYQGRSLLIPNSAGAPEPVIVKTVPPRPRVTAVTPDVIPQNGSASATIHFTGNQSLPGRILIYRTDLAGPPHLLKTYEAPARGGRSVFNGVIGGAPAPQGTYLIGLKVTDRACNTGRFPAELPPVAGTTPGAGLTVRYLAVQPPLTPVPEGSRTTVYVDARRQTYHWVLRRAGSQKVISSGVTDAVALRLAVPRAGSALDELAVRYGTHGTAVPLVVDSAGSKPARILVVVPALTWQGLNPVDETGDGLPSTLAAGDRIELARPLVDGLPAGFGDEAALVAYLRRAGLAFDLTTDLALTQGAGPALSAFAGVVLAGDERWVPEALSAKLHAYVAGGGHALSLGIDSLRRTVQVTDTAAFDPSGPQAQDVFGARPGAVVADRGTLILAGRDALHIFTGTSGALRGYRSYQPFAPVTSGGPVASLAGASSSQPAVIGFRLGSGIVIEVGLPGFGASLASNFNARQLLGRLWAVLSR
jgi:hypothetical protein